MPPSPDAPLSLPALLALCTSLPPYDSVARQAIALREATLTKPPASLGRLEDLTQWLGGWQHRATPRLDAVQVLIFAGNHGMTAHGVSPWPMAVTAQMVDNFRHGGAAINQIARTVDARLDVICLNDLRPTADFTTAPAMTEHDFLHAVATGFNAVSPDCDLLCLGEMGIGNTTAASAMAAALTGRTGPDWAGHGTGLDDAGARRKAAVIDMALHRHAHALGNPLDIARRLGGYELAAMLGATLGARHKGVPVLLDGFVCLCAAAPLAMLNTPGKGLAHTQLSHCATPDGHTSTLATLLGLSPLLGLGLRLGEGSGAALAVSILRAALACHTGMATFGQAAVSTPQA